MTLHPAKARALQERAERLMRPVVERGETVLAVVPQALIFRRGMWNPLSGTQVIAATTTDLLVLSSNTTKVTAFPLATTKIVRSRMKDAKGFQLDVEAANGKRVRIQITRDFDTEAQQLLAALGLGEASSG